jgi:hypothetical protein
MHAIVYRSKPGQPWLFITYHSGTREEAEQSAKWTEEQERKVFKRAQTVVKVLDAEAWDRGVVRGTKSKQTSQPRQVTIKAEPEPDELPGLLTLFKEDKKDEEEPIQLEGRDAGSGPGNDEDGEDDEGLGIIHLQVGDDSP